MYITIVFSFIITITIGSNYEGKKDERTFTNPILNSGADPWIIYHNGWYYYTNSSGSKLILRKAKNLDSLKTSEQKIIWTPPTGTNYSRELWAPEIHYINQKWYIYFAADDGSNKNHRIYVIENSSDDPMNDRWEFKGKASDPSDKWAIDASVFQFKNKLYMIWSGWEGDVNGQQNIYIASMANPWTIEGKRGLISKPELAWETIGDLNNPNDVSHVNVNEGPVALLHDKNLFVVYSASGCWTDNYCLGMIKYIGKGDLLDPLSWKKSPEPVFKEQPKNNAYGPGHNSFFNSPDGKEDWILYHANSQAGQGCGRYRSPRAQKFTWNKDGSPNLGEPVSTDKPLAVPSEKTRSK
jgi:GH43 family beta-xylosidase